MALPEHILLTYGYILLFAWVLVEQLGIPLPAVPILLAAGALSSQRELSFPLALAAGLTAALVADSAWFFIGRKYGHHVLRLLCKLSLEPTTCVRRTQNSFGRRRAVTLVIAKFVPGLATLAPPVAGQNGMAFGPFLLYDGIGSALWVGVLLTAGRFFGDLLKRNPGLLDWTGRFSELVPDPFTLPGAILFSPDSLAERHTEIPRDRDVVLFCACPSEATAAKTAMTLHKLGIERVRPLRGGYDEWKRLGFPLDAVPLPIPA
jgi:membrane protein DedA with SNARE-associated domain